jgi:DNA gyrase subunit A
VLPARLPNLLLNGAVGIAVGMATSIPPHNLRELIRACVHLLDHPDADTAELMRFVLGPDFPTGGKLLNTPEELLEIYSEGSGSLKIAGECVLEEEGKERRLVITSIPYMLEKSAMIEKIAEHIRDGHVPQLVDIRDESTEDVRIVLELAPGADFRLAEAYLYKNTPLQSRFHVNLTCLVPEEGAEALAPRRLSLDEMLRQFLTFRMEILVRRLRHDLEQVERRIHLLEAFEAIFSDLDAVIRIVREADGKGEAAAALMARFALDEVQADAVLETKLYRISRLEIAQIQTELAERRQEAARLIALLASEEALRALLKEELEEIRKKYGDKRRTNIEGPGEEIEISAEDFVVREDTIVIVTRDGWVKRQRSYSGLSAIRVRENDELGWVIHTQTHQSVIFFTNKGKAYTLLADSIPATAGYGDPIQASFDFDDGERLVGVFTSDERCSPREVPNWFLTPEAEHVDPASLPIHMLALTHGGYGVRFPLDAYAPTSTRAGRSFIKLKDNEGPDDVVLGVVPSNGSENLCLASQLGRALICRVADIPEVKGRGRGVCVLKLGKGDVLLAFSLSTQRMQGLEVETNRGRREHIRTNKYPVTRRGGLGRPVLLRGHLQKAVSEAIVYKEPEPAADGVAEPAPAPPAAKSPAKAPRAAPLDAAGSAADAEPAAVVAAGPAPAERPAVERPAGDRLSAAIARGALLVKDLDPVDDDEDEQMSLW